MADGTVRGTFDLNIPARRKMRELRREGELTDRQMDKLGRTMDRVGGPVAERRLRNYRREVRHLATDTEASTRRIDRAWSRSERKVLTSVTKQTYAIRDLRREVHKLGRERVSAVVDVDGISKALSQVELLIRRLRVLDRQRARAHVGVGGGGLPGGRGGLGGGGGGRGGILRSLSVGPLNINPRGLGALTAVGLPAVQSLIGAVGALTASLASAAAGFGALGIAASTAGAVGLGSIAAIAIPTTKRIQEAYKAQTDFTTATQDSVGAANTQSQALERSRQANENLRASQRQARYAQEALTAARRDARRELVDMALAADRSVLSERRAAIELRRAREEARRIENDPAATAIDRDEARLSLQEARLGLRESRVDKRRTTVDASRARRGGVQKMPGVVSARRQVEEANRGVADARRQIGQAADEMEQGASRIARSKQALDQAFARAPRGTRALIRDIRELKRLWGAPDEGTAPGGADPNVRAAQGEWVKFLSGGVGTLRAMTPTLGRAGLRSTRALNRERGRMDPFLRGKRTRESIGTSAAMFDENLTQGRRTAQYIAETMMNITVASRPFLLQGSTFIAKWTGGWAKSTRDVGKTRRRIGEMVRDLRSWKRLVGAAGRLTVDVFSAGRGEGRSAVDRLTGQLDTWDRWVKRNPREVRSFFKRTVASTIDLARALTRVVRALSKIADLLRPILDHFSQLATFAGDVGLLNPGGLALGYAAYKGAKGARGGAAGAAGGLGGAEGAALGLGVGAGARGRGRGAGRGPLGPANFAGRIGGRASSAAAMARGAGRALWPVALGMGALDFASYEGNVQERSHHALSQATLGLIKPPKTDDENVNRGRQMARETQLGGGVPEWHKMPRNEVQNRRSIVRLTREIADAQSHIAGQSGAERKRQEGIVTELKYQRDLRRENLSIQRTERVLAERDKATKSVPRIRGAFDIRSRKQGPERAMTATVRDTLNAMRGLGPSGSKIVARNTLAWARQQAKGNPKMVATVERMERAIIRRFARMGRRIKIINGQIYEGSRREWKRIRHALSDPVERARQEVEKNFTRIQRKAVNTLHAMGFSMKEARDLIRDEEKPGATGTRARQDINAGPQGSSGMRQSDIDRPSRARGGRLPGRGLRDTVPMADGGLGAPKELVINRHTERDQDTDNRRAGLPTLAERVRREGRRHSDPFTRKPRTPRFRRRRPGTDVYAVGGRVADTGKARTQAAAGQVNLMGANPGLAMYALKAREMGLSVSSGRRPGSITSSGNVSLHSSGDALDLSNGYATAQELRFGQYAAQAWGTGLDELIHTPLGFGIKNGVRVPPYAASDHYDHVHIGDRTPAGGARGIDAGGAGGMLGSVKLTAPRSRVGGIPGASSTIAGRMYAKGLQKRINDRLGAAGGSSLDGFSGGGTAEANMRLGHEMMLAFGWPESEWSALRALWQGESGWQNVMNTAGSGATGIPQALPGSKMASAGADWRTNPATQIKWGLGYIKGRPDYGTPTRAYQAWLSRNPHWYSRGGRIPGFAGAFRRGGAFETRGPTAFMAGEGQPSGGRERVTVERLRGASTRAGRRQLVVQGPLIELNVDKLDGRHDLNELVGKAAEHAARKLTAALDGVAETPDAALAK